MIVSILDAAFSSYTFTDTSDRVFSELANKTKDYAGKMAFRMFDEQERPTEQGLPECAFDLLIAANQAGDPASNMGETRLRNIRQLLKPGGHFFLSVSVPSNKASSGNPTASDETMRRWEAWLQIHGFSVIDTCAPKPDGVWPHVVVAAQAVDECINLLRNPLQHPQRPIPGFETLTIIGGRTNRSRPLVEALTAVLQPSCNQQFGYVNSVEQVLQVDHDLASVLCITDLDEPLLKNFTAEKLDALKHLFQYAKSILWVCQGGVRGHEPFSAMMLGLSRTVRAEYSNLNLQMLDIDTVDTAYSTEMIANLALSLQIWNSWVKERSQVVGDMVWSVERELVIEKGRILIPRLRPKKTSNLRYNAARRIIWSEVNPHEVPIQLGCQDESASSTSLAMPVLREIPKLQVPVCPWSSTTTTVQVTHSLFPFVRIDGVGSVMLCAGMEANTNVPVFGMCFASESPAPTVSAWTIQQSELKLGPTDGLVLLAASLVAQDILQCASFAFGTLMVHDASAELARALRDGAHRRGIDLMLTSSTKNYSDFGEDTVHIHPKSPKSLVRKLISKNTSILIDLSTAKTDWERNDTSRVLRSCLSQNCDILDGSRFYRSTVRSFHHEAAVQQGKSALQAAVEDISSCTRTTPRDSVIVPLSKMATTTVEPSQCPIVLDGTETSIPIEMLPVDEGIIFHADKTYVLVGLAGELGQSLAQWMVHHGARNIVLSSRRPVVSPSFLESFSRDWGAVVKVMALLVPPCPCPSPFSQVLSQEAKLTLFPSDVTNREEVHASFAIIHDTMPPIAGIANGAMVLRDGTLETMTLGDWQTCVAPKVKGTLILDELFHDKPLDFFITFSSLTAVIGNMGQANYGAANAFMAALCAQRRELRGVAGSTMDISSVVGLGVVERSGVVDADYFSGLGFRNIAETDVHQLFAEAMIAGRPGGREAHEIVTGIKPM